MAEKKKAAEPAVMTDEELVAAKVASVRAAQAKFATYTQEQVDYIFYKAAMAADNARIPLAKMAVEETGMGVLEDKITKNHYAAEFVYNHYRNSKTCGIVEEDKEWGIKKVAEPLGVIAAIIPTTNPTSTAIFKTLIALKTRNGMIISPHPRAKKCTCAAAKVVLDAAVAAGAPEGIIDWFEEPSIQISGDLMKAADCILATGGPGMVTAAYSSGKPALGVGPGNVAVIIDESADIKDAAYSIIHSKTFDNGMICASEQTVFVNEKVYDAVKAEFKKYGCYFLNADERKKVGETVINFPVGNVNAKVVGQSAYTIAQMAGVSVPENTKVLIGEVTSTEFSEPFAHEKLSPVLGMYKIKDLDDGIEKASTVLRVCGGIGHTAGLHVKATETDKINKFAEAMKTCRIIINSPTAHGGIGDIYNFKLAPSLTLGCGSWAGNSRSENIGIFHLLNIKTVAERRENMLWLRTPEKIYHKKGCMQLALRELRDEYHCKKAFIVTDTFLYQNGYTKPIEEELDRMGITHACFFEVAPDPTLQTARVGLKQLDAFGPDVIIALGGGSSMDAAKIMWLMYEHPEEDFFDLASVFMDIRKRIHKFPKMGIKAKLVCIPTSAGTGSEVTPFAIITDADTGTKWPLADYELMPTMAIVDADNMMTAPRGLTSASGIDVLTHATEAFVSIMATDYTDGFAIKATQNVMKYLKRAYDDGPNDIEARVKMADAACMAGVAFANAFLGLCHSMAHKLGAYHHLPHGVANALLMCEVMKYNADDAPFKMGTFSQYKYPHALERYAELARYCGIVGKDDRDTFNKFIDAIEQLKADVGIKPCIKDYGIDEKYFLDNLDAMVEAAFNDQCTGANPVYPRMSDMKEIYLRCYYGK
ncbi:MAG TPA: bifunctional acetaldehyde-CoA/alcohol dehydrogenase [Firmicutes bacterium]|nr:bifunctional acetaldehyde-CoA/alcohol dehydrogenase [Bacillota bacterium]